MKKTLKRTIALLGAAMLTVFSLGTMSACVEKELPRYEEGYFQYAVREKNGKKFAYIVGLTELGQEQEYLIFPTSIGGADIYNIGYMIDRGLGGWRNIGNIYSENLKRLFFPYEYPTLTLENTGAIWLSQEGGVFYGMRRARTEK